MTTGLVVLKMVLMPSRAFLAILANSGPRWSMIGVSIARSTRSGSGVGPGICRKWRPGLRDEFWAIERLLLWLLFGGFDGPGAGFELECCSAVKPFSGAAGLSYPAKGGHPVICEFERGPAVS